MTFFRRLQNVLKDPKIANIDPNSEYAGLEALLYAAGIEDTATKVDEFIANIKEGQRLGKTYTNVELKELLKSFSFKEVKDRASLIKGKKRYIDKAANLLDFEINEEEMFLNKPETGIWPFC